MFPLNRQIMKKHLFRNTFKMSNWKLAEIALYSQYKTIEHFTQFIFYLHRCYVIQNAWSLVLLIPLHFSSIKCSISYWYVVYSIALGNVISKPLSLLIKYWVPLKLEITERVESIRFLMLTQERRHIVTNINSNIFLTAVEDHRGQ